MTLPARLVLIASSTAPSTAPGADLRTYTEQLIARASTGSTRDVDLRAAVGLAERMQGNAYRASLERSQRIETAVRTEGAQVGQHLLMKRRVSIVRDGIFCRLKQYRLRGLPGERKTAEWLRVMDAERSCACSTEATTR